MNNEYEDNVLSNLFFDVDSSMEFRGVKLDECNFITNSCHPKAPKKDVQTKNNLIVALRLYIKGELMVTQATIPPKSANTSKPEHKKYKTLQHPEEDEQEVLEFVEDEEEEVEHEVIPPGSSGILTSELNRIRENIVKTKLVHKGQLFHLPICFIQQPSIDPETWRQALEIREPHLVHVQNLKRKMKINPHATVVPFLVVADLEQSSTIAYYTYYVIGGSHST